MQCLGIDPVFTCDHGNGQPALGGGVRAGLRPGPPGGRDGEARGQAPDNRDGSVAATGGLVQQDVQVSVGRPQDPVAAA